MLYCTIIYTCFIPTDKQSTADDVVALLKCLSWPCDKVFPALDILRLAATNPAASKLLLHPDNRDGLLSLLFTNLSNKVPATCQMLSLRTFCNLFGAGADAVSLLKAQREAVIARAVAVLPQESRPLQVALATLLLNYSVLSAGHLDGGGEGDAEAQAQLLTSICMLALESVTDAEGRLRTTVALGTLLAANPAANGSLAKDMMARAGVQAWRDRGEADGNAKLKECAGFVLAYL